MGGAIIVPMTTIDWHELTHAYGSAEDIPGLFQRLGGAEDDEVWQELWSSLCHQGSVYDASWAAVPRLTDIARGTAPGDRHQAVVLAGSIVVDTDDPRREEYASEIAELLGVARASVAEPGLSADLFVYLLAAVLSFEGEEFWAETLEGVNGEEYEVECPECEAGLFVAFGQFGTFVSVGDYVTGPAKESTAPRGELTPAAPGELTGIGARLHGAAVAHGQEAVARALTHVFGRGRCPACATEFEVARQIEELGY